MHGLVNYIFGKAQAADLISALGERYEYQVAPPRLAMADIVARLRCQRMNDPHGRRDDRRQTRKSAKEIFDGSKPISEARNGRRVQALAPEVDQYIWWDGTQSISQLEPPGSTRRLPNWAEVPRSCGNRANPPSRETSKRV